AAAGDAHDGVEALDSLYELGRSASVQALFVDDFEDAHHRVLHRTVGARFAVAAAFVAHFPASTRLAMVTYLRPADWAAVTASSSGHSSWILASLTSIGMLIPARTST